MGSTLVASIGWGRQGSVGLARGLLGRVNTLLLLRVYVSLEWRGDHSVSDYG